MPLSEKARIEVYLPDLTTPGYRELLDAFDQEFTYTFGGCTSARGLGGSYLSRAGLRIQDRLNIVYTDTPFCLEENFEKVARYAAEIRQAAFAALAEEAVLVVVSEVYHAE